MKEQLKLNPTIRLDIFDALTAFVNEKDRMTISRKDFHAVALKIYEKIVAEMIFKEALSEDDRFMFEKTNYIDIHNISQEGNQC